MLTSILTARAEQLGLVWTVSFMDADSGNVRATAIAKLKRAASLPRMKDGRRPAPPAHGGDAASENERGRSQEPDGAGSPAYPTSTPTPPAEPEHEHDLAPESSAIASATEEPESDAPAQAATPAKKHRTRSRSRSRSKQRLKDGSRPPSRQQLSSTPLPVSPPPRSPPLPTSDHDSPDQQPSSLPAFDHPPLMLGSPTTSPLPFLSPTGALMVQSPFSPTPMSPYTPAPMSPLGSPALPSLDVLRERFGGLQRSASARARTDALHKLTGGKVDPDHVEPGPPSPPLPAPRAALNRSNTVGGERVAVGRLMMRKLTERNKGIPEGETSGEEIVVPVSPLKKRRRRSSQGRRNPRLSIVDDREMTATPAPATPLGFPQRLLPGTPSLELDLYRGASPALSHTQAIERDRDSALARLIGEDHFEFDKHAVHRRREPVVEDDYNEDYAHNYGFPPRAPETPSIALTVSVPNARLPHSSDAPSFATTSSSIGSMADRVPVYLPDPSLPSPYKQDVFPKSPFGTPMKERRSSEVELDMTQDSYLNELQVPYPSPSRQNTPSWQTFPGARIAAYPASCSRSTEPLYHDDSDEDVTSRTEPTEDVTQLSVGEAISAGSTQDYGQIVQAISYRDHEEDDEEHEPEDVATSTSADLRASEISTTSTLDATADTLTLAPPQQDTRPGSIGADWEEIDANNDITVREPLRGAASPLGTPLSAWDKFKGAISRNEGSASPQMISRSASRADRLRSGHASQTSTDSMASSSSSRMGVAEPSQGPSVWHDPQYQAPLQTSSAVASSSILTMPPPSPFGGSSPIPPMSPADMAKYGGDSKLQPFPALAEMARRRGFSVSQSTPDVSIPGSGRQTPISPPTAQFAPGTTEQRPTHGLLHQASDSKLLSRFNQAPSPAPGASETGRPALKNAPSLEYIDLPMSSHSKTASGGKSGKFSWMKMRSASPGPDGQRPGKQRKPSLADLLSFKKAPDPNAPNGNGNGNGHVQHPPSFRQTEHPVMDLTAVSASRTAGASHQFQEAAGAAFSADRLPNRDMHNGRVPARVASEEIEAPSSSDALPRTSQSDAIPVRACLLTIGLRTWD